MPSVKKITTGGKVMRKCISMAVAIIFVAAIMLSGCSSAKKPAEEALKAAEQAIKGAKGEAEKVVPDMVKSLEGTLNSAKEKFGKGDYKAALADAQGIPGKVKEVLEAAKAKKEELTKSWDDLSQGLPKMMDAIKGKVDSLSKSKKLPKDVTKEKVEEAKTWLAEAMNQWGQSQESFKTGNIAEAVTKAKTIKEKADQMIQSLGISAPKGTKS
jgi:PBP1b-binding outer membrane lipoprotein LpoB